MEDIRFYFAPVEWKVKRDQITLFESEMNDNEHLLFHVSHRDKIKPTS